MKKILSVLVLLMALGLTGCGSLDVGVVYNSTEDDVAEAESINQQVIERLKAMGDEVPAGIIVTKKLPAGLKIRQAIMTVEGAPGSNRNLNFNQNGPKAEVLPGYKHKVLGTISLRPELGTNARLMGLNGFGDVHPEYAQALNKLKQVAAAAGADFVYILQDIKISQGKMGLIEAVAIKLDPAVRKKLKQK